MEALHKLGRGSDQADCVIVAADRMIDREWPYQPSEMSSKNAMSCGPGWVATQAPAIDLGGYQLNLFLCWVICVTVIGAHLGWDRTAAILTLVGLSPGTWLTAGNGSDFLTFGIAILAFAIVAREWNSRQHTRPWWIVTAVLLGLLAQFRVVTLLIPAFFAKQLSKGTAVAAWLLATTTVLAFLSWNPHAFVYGGPFHLAAKLMRGSVISDKPAIAALELGIASAIGFAVVYFGAQRTTLRQPLLWFLLLVFLLPGLQDLILKYHRFGHVLRAFEFWEGGMWIEGCVPLAAAGLLTAAYKDNPPSLS